MYGNGFASAAALDQRFKKNLPLPHGGGGEGRGEGALPPELFRRHPLTLPSPPLRGGEGKYSACKLPTTPVHPAAGCRHRPRAGARRRPGTQRSIARFQLGEAFGLVVGHERVDDLAEIVARNDAVELCRASG